MAPGICLEPVTEGWQMDGFGLFWKIQKNQVAQQLSSFKIQAKTKIQQRFIWYLSQSAKVASYASIKLIVKL